MPWAGQANRPHKQWGCMQEGGVWKCLPWHFQTLVDLRPRLCMPWAGAGLNVARMAEMPEAVVLRAGARAAAMEADTLRRLNRRAWPLADMLGWQTLHAGGAFALFC